MKWRGAAIGGGATSGALGPAVASRNKGGQYLRARVVPSGGVPTPSQEVIRNAVRSVVPSWSALTADQRAAWSTYAANVTVIDALGDSIQLSGQNWFVGSNVLRTQAGASLISNGPTTYDRGGIDLTEFNWVAVGFNATLNFPATIATLTGGNANDRVLIYVGRDFSVGRSKYFGSFQLAADIAGSSTQSAVSVTIPFAHDTNNLMVLQLVVSRADGRYSTPSRFTVSLP